MLSGVKVKSEQISLESLAEDGKRLRRPDTGREFIPPLRLQNREELWLAVWPLLAISDGGTSQPADVVERSAWLSHSVWPVFGGRRVQFHW